MAERRAGRTRSPSRSVPCYDAHPLARGLASLACQDPFEFERHTCMGREPVQQEVSHCRSGCPGPASNRDLVLILDQAQRRLDEHSTGRVGGGIALTFDAGSQGRAIVHFPDQDDLPVPALPQLPARSFTRFRQHVPLEEPAGGGEADG